MKRELDNFLIQWAQKKQRKPLLLRGARQTGKSYAVEKLAESFPYFVCINFEKNPSKYPSVPLGLKISEQKFARKENIAALPLYSVLQLQDLYDQLKPEINE